MIAGKIVAGKLISDLKGITIGLPKAVEEGSQDLAAAIAVGAQIRALREGSVQAHVESGISSSGAEVRLDAPRFPMILGAEFGGGGRPTTRQFPPHRGPDGYMLFPEVREHEDEIVDIMGKPIDEVLD